MIAGSEGLMLAGPLHAPTSTVFMDGRDKPGHDGEAS
jgi:hypothetical protein